MMYTAKVTFRYDIRAKHLQQSEHHVEFFNLSLVVH
jgi:hypothetical protein